MTHADIADYALIGDCETAALVSRDGSIDWLCWPRFDSDACFAALLGTPDNGRWRIAPKAEEFRVSRKYRADTLILETRFETDEGVATLIDFMPLRNDTSDLVRLVVGESGRVTMCMELIAALRLRLHRAVGHAACPTARSAPSPARTWCCCARRSRPTARTSRPSASSPSRPARRCRSR